VLKLCIFGRQSILMPAAAFGRLCVETFLNAFFNQTSHFAAAFGRLCVETLD